MSGVLNNIGSVSGILGTTEGAGGSTSASDLDSGTLGFARMAAGSVIQIVPYRSSFQVSVSSTVWGTTYVAGTYTITPLSASSDILLVAMLPVWTNSSANYCCVDFYKNASDFAETGNLSGGTEGISFTQHNGSWQMTCLQWNDTCSENSLSEKTYKISGRNYAGGGSSTLGWDAPGGKLQNSCVLYEIAR